MTADFSTGKVDLKKVSKTVKDYVANIAKMEGNKKRIDSEREFFALSDLLSGNAFNMNKDELDYVQGLMIEYQEQKFNDSVTDNTKKEVSKIAKRMGNKKKIDSDEEAQALATMLRNSHNELNAADLAYVRTLLIENGYAHYLNPDSPQVNVVNVIINEEKAAEPIKNEVIPKEETKQVENQTKSDKSRRKYYPPKHKVKPEDKPKDKEVVEKPKVDEAARAQGFGIANKIEEELHDTWTNNDVVCSEFKKVTRKNAYSFVGKMIEVTDTHSVFGDSRKRITYNEFKRVSASLLNQAQDIGLVKTQQYKNLKAEYDNACRQLNKDLNKTPDEYDTNKMNKALSAMYDEMSKVYK